MKNYKKERAEARKKAKELVAKMTLMEKAARVAECVGREI